MAKPRKKKKTTAKPKNRDRNWTGSKKKKY